MTLQEIDVSFVIELIESWCFAIESCILWSSFHISILIRVMQRSDQIILASDVVKTSETTYLVVLSEFSTYSLRL